MTSIDPPQRPDRADLADQLAELRFVEAADVYKAGQLAGGLRRVDGAVELRYDPTYLEAAATSHRPPIASTLPISDVPVRRSGGAVPPFFAGLLPEGRRLSALRAVVKTSADDDLSLLLAVGADPIGDVQVVPAGAPPTRPSPVLTVDRWDELRFADLYASATGSSLPDRVGIPGVQEKVSAALITLPVSTTVASYLVKLAPPEYPGLVENEAFFSDAARASGLTVAETTIVRDRDGRSALLVHRFDRVVDGAGTLRHLAQEDACQALDRYPADKYAVRAEDMAAALVRLTRAQPIAARDLFAQLTFAHLSCNGDAHAKNFSVLCDLDGEWRVSPAYDLTSTYPYGDTTTALRIGGKHRDDIGRADLLSFAATIGLRERAARRVLDAVVEASTAWMARLDELPYDDRRLTKLSKAIAYRRQRLSSQP